MSKAEDEKSQITFFDLPLIQTAEGQNKKMIEAVVNYVETYYSTKKSCDELYLKLVIFNTQLDNKCKEPDFLKNNDGKFEQQ